MYDKITREAIKFLEAQQRSSGNFEGWSGTSIQDFNPTKSQPTIFPSALITRCLSRVPHTQKLRSKATSYLLANRSTSWTWNYWERNTPKSPTLNSYPDDLDDTANALLAIHLTFPETIDGHALAYFSKTLISREVQVGGPYRTWITQNNLKAWNDIDPVVNANIGAFLQTQKVGLHSLERYAKRALLTDTLQSQYYVSDIPTIYFLSAWFSDDDYILRARITELLSKNTNNALMLSMLICAAYNYSLNLELLQTAINQLLALQNNSRWPAEALYLDPLEKGQQLYAGSSALTTAFAIEALNKYTPKNIQIQVTPAPSETNNTRIEATQKTVHDIRQQHRIAIQKIRQEPRTALITTSARLFNKAYGNLVDDITVDTLSRATINGWIAYDTYDDFLDKQGNTKQLPLANRAARHMYASFHKAMPNNSQFLKTVDEILDTIDSANLWEQQFARASITHGQLTYQLPNYKSLSQLADRSLGLFLAPYGIALASNKPTQPLRKFFQNFLIARQLHDDAHDWEEDLKNGQLSAVVVMLLEKTKPTTCIPERDIVELRKYFWRRTITDVALLIEKHCAAALLHLDQCRLEQTTDLARLILPMLESVKQIRKESLNAAKFLDDFRLP